MRTGYRLMLELNHSYNMDCMQGMAQFPDGYFDLAVVDPPYGGAGNVFKCSDKTRFGGRFDRYRSTAPAVQNLAGGGYSITRTGGAWAAKYGKKIIAWDNAPRPEYFDELFRVSKQQIIWGGNYFDLPPCRCFLIWNKPNIPTDFTMAQCEFAWCSLNENAKLILLSSTRSKDAKHWHPTEKPISLYDWIFRLFCHPGDKILDTHLGSGNSRKAAYDAGLDFIGFEVDPEYYAKGCADFDAYAAQQSLFRQAAAESAGEQLCLL